MLVRRKGEGGALAETTVVVDTSPDFRLQAVAAGVKRVDATLFTHDHADQAHGIDDLRPFFLNQRRTIPTYMDDAYARRPDPPVRLHLRHARRLSGHLRARAVAAARRNLEPRRAQRRNPGADLRSRPWRDPRGRLSGSATWPTRPTSWAFRRRAGRP
jgi:glyoxylase-like metal-dependent hydrolase (beta-lactamase superfamily II)